MKIIIKSLLIFGMILSGTCNAFEQNKTEFRRFLHEVTPLYKTYVYAFNVCYEDYVKASKMVKNGQQVDKTFKELALEDKNSAQEKLTLCMQKVQTFENSSDELIRELAKEILKIKVYGYDALEQIYAYIDNSETVLNSPDAVIKMANNADSYAKQSQYIDSLYDKLMIKVLKNR